MDKKYRTPMLYPLGWENNKPVPVPEGFGENQRSNYVKTGDNKESGNLKPFNKSLKDYKNS